MLPIQALLELTGPLDINYFDSFLFNNIDSI